MKRAMKTNWLYIGILPRTGVFMPQSVSPARSARTIAIACLLGAASVHAESPSSVSRLKLADPSQLVGARTAGTARPAVGVPLMQAQTAVDGGHFAEALNKVREAEHAAIDASSYEIYIINRTKAAAAWGAGQTELAFAATEAAIATKVPEREEQFALMESLVHAAYAAKDYARAARWAARYAEEGGSKPDIATLRMQAQYLAGDYAGAVAALQAAIKANDEAGRTTSERELQMLASAQGKLHDEAGLAPTMERLATGYPKPAYWSALLARIDRRSLADRLFLDLFRLARATGSLADADEHVALANLAQSAGFAGEALAVLDDGLAKGVLGHGPDAGKHRALRDKARKLAADDAAARQREEAAARASRDANALTMLGQIAAAEGRFDTGIALMEQGLQRGGVRRTQEARMRLGEAQALAGRSAQAAETLASVEGPEGLSELARLWRLYASIAAPTAPRSP